MHKVRNTSSLKVTRPFLLKKVTKLNVSDGSGGLKKLPILPQKFYPFMRAFFFLEYKSSNGHQTFREKRM